MAGYHRCGRQISHRFDGCDEIDKGNRDEGRQIKAETVFERDGDIYQGQTLQGAEIDLTHERGNDIPDDQSDHDRAHSQKLIFATRQDNNDNQDKKRQKKVLGAAKQIRFVVKQPFAAGHIHDAHLNQTKADEGDNRSGNDRCNYLSQMLQESAENHLNKRAKETYAKDS